MPAAAGVVAAEPLTWSAGDDIADAIVAEVHAIRPKWSEKQIRLAVIEAIRTGRSLEEIAAAFPIGARRDDVRIPHRLPRDGPWWAAEPGGEPAEVSA